jgi:ABC-2 type transport system permease protein/oleandomycin transport system permease protein
MTSTTLTPTLPTGTPSPASATARRTPRRHAVADAVTMTWRNLLTYVRLPQLLVFSTIQPIMLVLLFRYVFGKSINLSDPSVDYVDYLMPGVFVQATVFGALGTGVGLAEDLNKGLVERFRSLPMARSAVLAGRTIADATRNAFVLVLMTGVGLLVGFRIHGGVPAYLAALALVLLFTFALSWMAATVGLGASNGEAAQAALFPLVFPLVFASSAFVDTSFMPGWLQAFANHQPVTVTIDAARNLVLDQPVGWSVVGSIAWSLGLIAVFGPLAVRRYRRAA